MTEDQITQLFTRLDQIIAILEDQTYMPANAEPEGCQHEDAIDIGTMGDAPGSKIQCKQCGKIIDREANYGFKA